MSSPKKSYTFISKDKAKLLEMLLLREAGFSFNFLADFYGCDRTSLRYQCRKYKVFPNKTIFISNSKEVFNPQKIATHIIVQIFPQGKSNWTVIDGERVNMGKNYADYLKTVSPYKTRV